MSWESDWKNNRRVKVEYRKYWKDDIKITRTSTQYQTIKTKVGEIGFAAAEVAIQQQIKINREKSIQISEKLRVAWINKIIEYNCGSHIAKFQQFLNNNFT